MRLLVYGINYLPELTGIGKYTGEMCEWLVSQGHEVEVITTVPYYPEWSVHPAYKNKLWHTENRNGVLIHRTPFYVPQQVTGKTRILHELSFGISSLLHWVKIFARKKFDLVLAIYPPLPIGLYPVMYRWIRKVPMVFHIQDLQVDAARDLNIIKNQRLLDQLERVEKFYCKQADWVTTISEGMREKISEKGIPEQKIGMFPNWVNTDLMAPMPNKKAALKQNWGYQPDQKVVLYSGNMGEKQGLEVVLDTAEMMGPTVQFRMVGQGGIRNRLEAIAQKRNLQNVQFSDLVPLEELPELLNMADFHLVLQKKGATDLVMPSKLTGILSVGGVPIVTAEKNSSLRTLIEQEQIGLTADPEDAQALFHLLQRHLFDDLSPYQKRSRAYAIQELGQDAILSAFVAELEELIRDKAANVSYASY
ncbi:MAG: WcaI family glycosyltransferase [Bacteroidota bacterium]